MNNPVENTSVHYTEVRPREESKIVGIFPCLNPSLCTAGEQVSVSLFLDIFLLSYCRPLSWSEWMPPLAKQLADEGSVVSGPLSAILQLARRRPLGDYLWANVCRNTTNMVLALGTFNSDIPVCKLLIRAVCETGQAQ